MVVSLLLSLSKYLSILINFLHLDRKLTTGKPLVLLLTEQYLPKKSLYCGVFWKTWYYHLYILSKKMIKMKKWLDKLRDKLVRSMQQKWKCVYNCDSIHSFMSKAFLFIDRVVTSYPWITINIHWYFPNSVIDIPNFVGMVTKLSLPHVILWNVKYTASDEERRNFVHRKFSLQLNP